MKQKDILVIVLAVFLGGLISYFISSALFAAKADLTANVEIVDPISAEFNEPDKRYFNEKSINPTQQIVIGGDTNQQPFQSED